MNILKPLLMEYQIDFTIKMLLLNNRKNQQRSNKTQIKSFGMN